MQIDWKFIEDNHMSNLIRPGDSITIIKDLIKRRYIDVAADIFLQTSARPFSACIDGLNDILKRYSLATFTRDSLSNLCTILRLLDSYLSDNDYSRLFGVTHRMEKIVWIQENLNTQKSQGWLAWWLRKSLKNEKEKQNGSSNSRN
jgi:hypothetical protein